MNQLDIPGYSECCMVNNGCWLVSEKMTVYYVSQLNGYFNPFVLIWYKIIYVHRQRIYTFGRVFEIGHVFFVILHRYIATWMLQHIYVLCNTCGCKICHGPVSLLQVVITCYSHMIMLKYHTLATLITCYKHILDEHDKLQYG